MPTPRRARNRLAALGLVLIAAALVALAALARTDSGGGVARLPLRIVAVPTGELDQGIAIYRLPSVSVSAWRGVKVARISRGDTIALR